MFLWFSMIICSQYKELGCGSPFHDKGCKGQIRWLLGPRSTPGAQLCGFLKDLPVDAAAVRRPPDRWVATRRRMAPAIRRLRISRFPTPSTTEPKGIEQKPIQKINHSAWPNSVYPKRTLLKKLHLCHKLRTHTASNIYPVSTLTSVGHRTAVDSPSWFWIHISLTSQWEYIKEKNSYSSELSNQLPIHERV